MSDLISRETLLETFEEYGFNQEAMIPIISLMKVLEIVEHQPTAFDVEKVLEELDDAYNNGTLGDYHEIVKRGGKDE